MGQTVNKTTHILVDRTRHLIAQRPRTVTLDMLSEACGVDADFIQRFSQGKIKNPSIHKTVTLYEHLSGRRVEI